MKPFAWSYSALVCYEQCPKKYYHLYVIKDVKDADSSFAADGKAVHQAMEARVVHGRPLPMPMRSFEKLAKAFADTPGEKHGETKMALDRRFEPVGFFDNSAWVRVVIDLTIVRQSVAIVVDWKTGKVKNDFTQLGLNAAVLSRWMPEIQEFRTLFGWLQSGSVAPRTYKPTDIPGVWNDLLPRVARIEEARKTTDFPAKSGPLCGWCPVSSCPHFAPRDER
jgi:hypothetical protein